MVELLSRGGQFLSSLWLTLIFLLWLVVILVVERMLEVTLGPSIGYATAVPFAGLFLNLLAAIFTNKKIRQQSGLLIFHLALAAIAVLAASSRFVYLKGHVEVTTGVQFDASQVVAEKGALHQWGLDRVNFLQGPFHIEYAPRMKRRGTKNQVFLFEETQDDPGKWRKVLSGDDKPLLLNGYRFYPSFNKGFALALTFTDAQGNEHAGTIHMPLYPLQDAVQGNEWVPFGSKKPILLWLNMAPIYDVDAAWTFRVPKDATVTVTDGDQRHELTPGQSVKVRDGTLRFNQVTTWMGYSIHYDPTKSWMLAAAILAVLGLVWHVLIKITATPWEAAQHKDEVTDAR